MLVSAEGFFLLNFVMDFLVLTLALRGTWFPRARRTALAALLGAAYALTDGAGNLPWYADALALSAMLALAIPRCGFRQALRAALAAANAAVVIAAAIQALMGLDALLAFAWPLGILAGALASRVSRGRIGPLPAQVGVRVQVGERKRCFLALIDTGNTVREPLSGLPVLIVTERALKGDFRPEEAQRSVSYGGVGASGILPCIRPRKLELYDRKRWIPAPEMWLGVYSGKINGSIEALAPGAVLQAVLHR